MKRIFRVGMIVTVGLVLAACFPKQNLYKIEGCTNCGIVLKEGAELAFVKETTGDNWRLWQKQSDGYFNEVCIGTVENNEFSCDACGPGGTFKARGTNSGCGYRYCFEIDVNGGSCPNNGTGKGGHN